jgi:hypothetical protein
MRVRLRVTASDFSCTTLACYARLAARKAILLEAYRVNLMISFQGASRGGVARLAGRGAACRLSRAPAWRLESRERDVWLVRRGVAWDDPEGEYPHVQHLKSRCDV